MLYMQIAAFLFLTMTTAAGAILGWGAVKAAYVARDKAARWARLGRSTRPLVRLSDTERELRHIAAMRAPYGWDKVDGGATK